MQGFRKFDRPGVPVTLNSVARVDAKLEVGQLAETVTVSAESPLLQTDRAEVRSELNAHRADQPAGADRPQLPAPLQDAPGFTPPDDAHSIPSNPSRALVFNVNGSSDSSNNTRIDGVSTTNIWLPHVAAYMPALESLETVNVVTNSFDAEQGLAGGSAINVQIKSGTNQLRARRSSTTRTSRCASSITSIRRARRKATGRITSSAATLGGPIVTQQTLLLRQLREHARQAERHAHGLGADRRRCAAATCRVADTDLRPGDRQRERLRTDAVPQQHRSGNRIDPIAQEDYRSDAAAEPAGRDEQLLRPVAVQVQPVDARHEGELERDVEAEHLRPLQPARFLDVQRGRLRTTPCRACRSPAAIPAPARATRRTSRPAPRTSFSPTLVADAHFGYVRMYTGVEHSDIGRTRPGLSRDSRTERAAAPSKAACRVRLRHLPGRGHHRALHAV